MVLDKLTYAGDRDNLDEAFEDPAAAGRLRFVRGDIADPAVVAPLVAEADAVVNFAAESHVDRSILAADDFLRTGVIGVHVLLEAVRAAAAADARPRRLLQVSTDEVYGSVETGESREGDPLAPRSPYAAAKAAGELLVQAYHVTHGLDTVITRGANTYGPHQHPEKLVPLFITSAIQDLPLPIYGDGLQRRDWLYVDDHADGVAAVLERGASGGVYNLPGAGERTNRDVTAAILDRLHKPWSLARRVPDRPGHDRRYAMTGARAEALGWQAAIGFEDGMTRTVAWYLRPRGMVAPPARRGLGRLLRAPVRPAAGRFRRGVTGPADAPTVVTGARGRLGRALVAHLASADRPAVAWDRPEYDLDSADAAAPLVARDRPGLVIHCAAWTDVDGCARDPETAMRRNARAVRELAEATAATGTRLVVVSTNEVFDGTRTDGRPYREDDPVEPANAYGASKLAGERAAVVAYGRAGRPADLWVMRTAWLFGPGAPDFPAKILAAADRLPPGAGAAGGRR